MTYFMKTGKTVRPTPFTASSLTTEIEAGTYAVKCDDHGFFLEVIENFEMPSKLYGDCTKNAGRIINTFKERPASTGVFLEGEKGSGKTLLGKKISIDLIAQGVPTLVVNTPFSGEGFNTFIQSINQPKVVFFDEFEKVYDEDEGHQERVLTLFDGVYPSKTLFIVTCNDSWRIDKNMKNRPGRMYYMLSFDGLDAAFIREYAEEKLNDKTQVDSILSIATLFGKFNFDMLKAIVEEMNRYGETAQDAIKLLNAKPNSNKENFDMELWVGGKSVPLPKGHSVFHGNPLSSNITAQYIDKITAKNEAKSSTGGRGAGFDIGTRDWIQHMFYPTDLQQVDGEAGTFLYVNADGDKLQLTRQKSVTYDYSHLL